MLLVSERFNWYLPFDSIEIITIQNARMVYCDLLYNLGYCERWIGSTCRVDPTFLNIDTAHKLTIQN